MTSGAPTLTVEPGGLVMPASAWTHEGFREWVKSDRFPEHGVRATYVDGEVFLSMSPESIESHNKPKTAITVGLGRIAADEDIGELYSDRVLLTLPAAGVSTEPDVVFASWATLQSKRLGLVPRATRSDEFVELEGIPDLVVEVVSDSSVRKDLVRLRSAYARGGIPEYWLVDARGTDISFQILVLRGGEYVESGTSSPQRSAVLGRDFLLDRTKNRVGRWSYVLDVP